MKPLLILVQPRVGANGARTDLRLSTGADALAAGLGGNPWEAAIQRRPRLTMELLAPDLNGKVQVGRGDFVINLNDVRKVDTTTLYWSGAPVVIYDARTHNLATAPVEFTGFVRNAQFDMTTGLVTLNLEVSTQALDKPVLFNEFTGAGGILGEPEMRGKPMPAGFGSVQNIEPVWFDTVRNIGMIDGYGNCTAIAALFEGGSDFGAKVADYATYAALANAIDTKAIKPGQWGTCVAYGLVGLGAPPFAPITVDATFNNNRPGSLIRRLIEYHAGVNVADVDTAAYAALDVAVNRPVHHWLGSQREVKDLVEAIAASCNATPLVTFQGKHSITRAFGGAVIATFDRQNPKPSPRVTQWRALEMDPPTWRMKMRAARPGATLSTDQIMYADDLIDMGVYDVTKTYRQGNLVWSAAGAQYLFKATSGTGRPLPVLPATSNTWWEQTKPAPAAADLFYADGTPIESLKPAAAGADPTGSNVSAGIVGQGALATKDRVSANTDIDDLDAIVIGGDFILEPMKYANDAELDAKWTRRVSNGTRSYGNDTEGVGGKYFQSLGVAGTPTYGPELVLNGDFNGSVTTNWTAINATLGIGTINSSPAISVTSTTNADGVAYQAITQEVGATYELTYTCRDASGDAKLEVSDSSAGTVDRISLNPGDQTGAITTYVATLTTHYVRLVQGSLSNGDTSRFDNISIRKKTMAGAIDGETWLELKGAGIPYDEAETYEVEAIVRRGGGSGTVYVGLLGKAADKTTIVGTDGSNDYTKVHWVGGNNLAPSNRHRAIGYVTGRSATGTSVQSSNPDAPGAMQTNVAWIVPVVRLNVGGDGAMKMLGLRVRRVENADRLKNGVRGTIAQSQVNASGLHLLTQGSSLMQIGDQRNLPPVKAINLGFKYTGSISVSAGTASATVTLGAGLFYIGSVSISYNGGSVVVNKNAGETLVNYHFYCVDSNYSGGTKTIIATQTASTIYNNDNNVYLGSVSWTWPSSGTTTTDGYAGGGGCPEANSWMPTRDRGIMRARDVVPGDFIKALTEDGSGTEWVEVTANVRTIERSFAWQSDESAVALEYSETTPLTLANGSVVLPDDYLGQAMFVEDEDGLRPERGSQTCIGRREVCRISCNMRTFAAGLAMGKWLYTHNPTQYQKP